MGHVSLIQKPSVLIALAALCGSAFLPTPLLPARLQDRVAQRIDDGRESVLPGSVHPLAQPQYDRGRLSAVTVLPRIVMSFHRTAEQQADLEQLLREQQDPQSPKYHTWLTPEQFAERFGLRSEEHTSELQS